MTIDEAIAQAERIAEGQEKSAELSPFNHAKERISKSAAEHRQLAAWLRELKKAKRLLSSLLSDTNDGSCTKSCYGCKHWDPERGCDYSARYEWKHTDEVIKLIGGDDGCI